MQKENPNYVALILARHNYRLAAAIQFGVEEIFVALVIATTYIVCIVICVWHLLKVLWNSSRHSARD